MDVCLSRRPSILAPPGFQFREPSTCEIPQQLDQAPCACVRRGRGRNVCKRARERVSVGMLAVITGPIH